MLHVSKHAGQDALNTPPSARTVHTVDAQPAQPQEDAGAPARMQVDENENEEEEDDDEDDSEFEPSDSDEEVESAGDNASQNSDADLNNDEAEDWGDVLPDQDE